MARRVAVFDDAVVPAADYLAILDYHGPKGAAIARVYPVVGFLDGDFHILVHRLLLRFFNLITFGGPNHNKTRPEGRGCHFPNLLFHLAKGPLPDLPSSPNCLSRSFCALLSLVGVSTLTWMYSSPGT